MNDENKIPYLKETFVAFYEDALHNWKRFAAEFAADGEIAKLTDAEKLLRWMPMTNDENEGHSRSNFEHSLIVFRLVAYYCPMRS